MMDENLTNPAPPLAPDMGEQANAGMTPSHTVSEDLGSPSSSVVQDSAGNAAVLEDAKPGARTLRENADRYVRENPTKAVFTALGIGFVCGLIFRR